MNRIMKNVSLILITTVLISVPEFCFSQDEYLNDQGDFFGYGDKRVERRILIDGITAGMLPRASFDFDVRTFTNGGVQAAVNVGLRERLSIGLSYGAAGLLSEQTPHWNDRMEFLLKYRIITEDYTIPSIAFGFSSQGSGYWDEENRRYAHKSKGFFIAATKSYLVYRNVVSFTLGVNVSMEQKTVDKDPTLYFGAITQLNKEVYILWEYDLATNDDKSHGDYGVGRGYFNAGLEWVLTEKISLEFDLRNILKNRRDAKTLDREIRLLYVEQF